MKIVVAGPFQCGKSSLIHYIDNKALNITTIDKKGNECTIAMDIGTILWKNLIKISIFGTPGLLRFHTMRNVVVEGTDGVLFIFDGTNPDMDDSAIQILNEIRTIVPRDIPIVYAVTKIDIPKSRPVDVVRDQNYLPKNAKIYGISSITGENINECLEDLINQIRANYSPLIKALKMHTENPLGLINELEKSNVKEVIELLHSMELRGIISINRKEMTYVMNELSEFYEV